MSCLLEAVPDSDPVLAVRCELIEVDSPCEIFGALFVQKVVRKELQQHPHSRPHIDTHLDDPAPNS